MTAPVSLLALDAADYRRHPLHEQARTWTETNCYIDVWVEVLHALGLDPMAGAAFVLSTDFEGDQWTFFKYPPEDLRAAYGIEVAEMNVWLPIDVHVAEQLALGRLLTVEVDAWYLPDVIDSYATDHVKTTIVPETIDVEGRRLGYFHSAGYFALSGDDYDGVFRRNVEPESLPPYVEVVKLDRLRAADPARDREVARALVREHLGRRPETNPMERFRTRLARDIEWLRGQDIEMFHLWAFGTCRQCGATAELSSSFCRWLDPSLAGAADDFGVVAESAKSLQFMLARAVRGRAVDVDPTLDEMAARWDAAVGAVVAFDGR